MVDMDVVDMDMVDMDLVDMDMVDMDMVDMDLVDMDMVDRRNVTQCNPSHSIRWTVYPSGPFKYGHTRLDVCLLKIARLTPVFL